MGPDLFLSDNLEASFLQAVTREAVETSPAVGVLMETVDGWPLLSLDESGERLVDAPLPLATLERLRSESSIKVVVFGLGLGNVARAVRQAGVRIAAIFEPDVGVIRRFFESGPSDLLEIPITSELEELDALWPVVVGDAPLVQIVDTPGYPFHFPAARTALTERITQLLERALINDQTWRARGRTWIRDIAENSDAMVTSASAHNLVGQFAGVPAFIVCAGPSLNKNVHLLPEAAKKGIVIAVNSSGKALDRAGVEPHVLACIESIDVSHLIRDLSFMDRVIRLFALSAHPNIYSVGSGPLLTLYELLPQLATPFEAFYGQPGMPVCASVSTAAFSVAQRLGCDPIVYVGQDLAYTGGRAYAKGTVFEETQLHFSPDGKSVGHEWCDTMKKTHETAPSKLSEGQRTEQVQAWGGEGFVFSTSSFSHIRAWLERVSNVLARAKLGTRLVNATEGGARIRGFEEKTLASLLEELPERNITREEILAKASSSGRNPSRAEVAEFFRKQASGARAVAEVARELAAGSEGALANWRDKDARSTARELKALERAEAKLREQVALAPWVDAWAWESIDGALEAQAHEAGETAGLAAEKRLGEAILSSALELSELLEARADMLLSHAAE